MLKAKYNMTREQSVTLAKRNIVDYIWKGANMEGIMVTFPETEALFKGVNVQRISVDEIVLINNLKHAWTFILETIDYPIDYGYICKINQVIGANLYYNAGFVTSGRRPSFSASLPAEPRVFAYVIGKPRFPMTCSGTIFLAPSCTSTTPVSIGGTDWKPDLPIESQVKKELEDIFTIESPTEKALTLMGYVMRKQMFIDGN